MSGRKLNRIGTAALLAAIGGLALVAASANGGGGPGGGGPTCQENDTLPACDFYTDADGGECPDVPLGGGQCGTVFAPVGKSGVSPSTPDCLVMVYAKNSSGDCESQGTFAVSVSCSRVSGAVCDNS